MKVDISLNQTKPIWMSFISFWEIAFIIHFYYIQVTYKKVISVMLCNLKFTLFAHFSYWLDLEPSAILLFLKLRKALRAIIFHLKPNFLYVIIYNTFLLSMIYCLEAYIWILVCIWTWKTFWGRRKKMKLFSWAK